MKAHSFRTGLRSTVLGNGASQFVLIVTGLVVARLYGPSVLGLFATYTALTLALGPLATLRYLQAIPLARERCDAAAILALCLALSITLPLIGMLLALIPLSIMGSPPIAWIVAVGLGTIVLSIQQSSLYFLMAVEDFSRYATSRVVYAIALLALQGTFALASRSAQALILAEILASIAAIFWSFARIGWSQVRMQAKRAQMLQVARRHLDFPRYQLPGGFLNSVALQAPVVLVGAGFGSTAAGLYSLAYRVLYSPIGLISQSVGAVFFPTAAKRSMEELPGRIVKTCRLIGILAFAYAAVLAVGAPLAMTRVLGDSWDQAVEMIWLLSPMMVIYATASAVSTTLIIKGELRKLFQIQVLLLATTVVPLAPSLAQRLGLLESIGLYSALQGAAYCYYLIAIYRVAQR